MSRRLPKSSAAPAENGATLPRIIFSQEPLVLSNPTSTSSLAYYELAGVDPKIFKRRSGIGNYDKSYDKSYKMQFVFEALLRTEGVWNLKISHETLEVPNKLHKVFLYAPFTSTLTHLALTGTTNDQNVFGTAKLLQCALPHLQDLEYFLGTIQHKESSPPVLGMITLAAMEIPNLRRFICGFLYAEDMTLCAFQLLRNYRNKFRAQKSAPLSPVLFLLREATASTITPLHSKKIYFSLMDKVSVCPKYLITAASTSFRHPQGNELMKYIEENIFPKPKIG